jgi:hypothetical protein
MRLFRGPHNFGITGRGRVDGEPTAPLKRSLSPKNCGRYWVCRCRRRHRIPNVTREAFVCPACQEVYRG